jgi:competence protein ComEA
VQPRLEAGATRASRGSRVVSSVLGPLAHAVGRAKAWQWLPALLKLAAAGAGLVLLGAIGTSARARGVLADAAPTAASSSPGPASPPAVVAASAAPPPPTPPSSAPPPAPNLAAGPGGDGGAPPAPQSPRGHATPDDPVYLNQAELADLRRLPGVGAKRAEAILALRTRLGHFRQLEDLLKVKGIGRSSLRKLRPLVRLDAPPVRGADGGDVRS